MSELPKKWIQSKIEDLFELAYGKGLRIKELTESGFDVYGANGIIGKYSKYNYEESKVLISCRGAASGAIHKTNPYSFVTSNSIVLNEVSKELLDLDFVKYCMKSLNKNEVITGTAQPQITIQLLKDLTFPLSPLAEQKRIVAKLDSLFEELDSLKERLANIPTFIKNFRQAVLTQAVTGKLTEEWRKGRELGEWYFNVDLGEYLTGIKYGTSKKSFYDIDGLPILRIPNISNGELNLSDLKYSILDSKEEGKILLEQGDILIIRSNGSTSIVGKCAIVRTTQRIGYAGYLVRLRTNKNLNSEYLNFMLLSPLLRSQIVDTARSTSGVNNINTTEIKELKINVSSLEEQAEIVKRIEGLFAQANAIEERYELLKEKIEQLPQAILAKAFKGELVEQLPTDGDAKDLLEEIKALKESMTKKPKKKRDTKKKVVLKEGEQGEIPFK